MLPVTFFHRAHRDTSVSIEGIFKLVEECLKKKIAIKDFYCDNKISRIKNVFKARKETTEINHISGDVNFLAIGFGGKKNVLTIHDLGHYDTLRKRNRIQFLIYDIFWFRLPLKNIDIVTVVSNFTKEKLINYIGFPESKIRLIYNPVKPVFKFAPKEKLNTVPRILQIGSGTHKNIRNLIIAVTGTEFHLDMVGFPSDSELALLNENKVSYTIYNGLTDEQVYERYVNCDILFFASFYEGFGMPIIEAQSVGRPVITSNIDAMKEVAKESAVLVDPNNPEQIREAMIQLISDPVLYKKMVTLGQENIIPFRHEIIAQQYLDVYNELHNSGKK